MLISKLISLETMFHIVATSMEWLNAFRVSTVNNSAVSYHQLNQHQMPQMLPLPNHQPIVSEKMPITYQPHHNRMSHQVGQHLIVVKAYSRQLRGDDSPLQTNFNLNSNAQSLSTVRQKTAISLSDQYLSI